MWRPSDPLAVADPETKVMGVEALRVVDSSIMPSITTGILNAPTIMIGERASDIIRGRAPLPASNASVPPHDKGPPGQDAIVVRRELDIDVLDKRAEGDRLGESLFEIRPQMEQRRDEHLAGESAQRIHVDLDHSPPAAPTA
jgi:GMC oxidoreductase